MPLFETEVFQKLHRKGNLVMPSYDGYGLVNLSSTIAHWLGAATLPAPIFGNAILENFADRYQNVVVILADALGYNQLKRLMEAGQAPSWRAQLDRGMLFPITSISPSTTASALTTIWTGTAPNQHGVIGYEMWYKDLGLVMNNILHTPITYRGDVGGLSRAGFEPTRFMNQSTLGQRLSNHGIESHAFLPASIANSGLSQMHLPGSQLHPFSAESDLLLNIRDLLNQPGRRKKFVYAYWSDVDSLMHRYGTYDERVTQQFFDFSSAFFRLLVEGLDGSVRGNTLILLTADHGSVETPVDDKYNLAYHPQLTSMLTLQPTCEGRLPFLYVKQGQVDGVRNYFQHAWPGEFDFMTRQQVLDAKLLGNGKDHPDLINRIGDLVAIPLGTASYLWWPDRPNLMLGRHGGLHEDEMLVPLFAVGL